MKVVYGDFWEYKADVRCITTNGAISKAGNGVMGAGVALQAKRRYRGLEVDLAWSLKRYGNHCILWPTVYGKVCFFPVKHHWRQKADLQLIQRSARELALIVEEKQDLVFVLPRPGCGNGGLAWEEVEPVMRDLLPDRVHVIDR